MKVKKMVKDARLGGEVPKMYAFSSQPSDSVVYNCKKVGIQYFEKPTNLEDAFVLLRHMADSLEN